MTGPGLRERKKAKTRRAIEDAAIRLVTEQGYDNTTIDQIAEAAEISPSTFFRYFPTKEDAVVTDDYDPLFIAAIARAPRSDNPVGLLQYAMREAFVEIYSQDREQIYRRSRLVLTTPALRAHIVEGTLQTQRVMGEAIAARTGGRPDDLDLQVLVAAAIAAMTVVLTRWVEGGGTEDLPVMIERALSLIGPG